MSQVQQVFKNVAVLALARLIERGSSLVLSFFVARMLLASGLGVYTAVMVLYELITSAAEAGSTSLIVREIGKDPNNTGRYFLHLAVLSGAAAAIMAGIFLAILPYLGFEPELATGMAIIALALVPGVITNVQESVFVARQRVEFVTLTTIVASIFNICASLFLLSRGFGVISLLISFVIVQVIVMFCYLFFINRYITPIGWEFDARFAIRLAKDIKVFAALDVVAALFSRPEIILLSLLSTTTQTGFYSAALKVITLWQFVPQIHMANVFPVMSRAYHRQDQASRTIQDKSIKYLLALSLPVAVGLFITAEKVVSLLYGPGFEGAVLPLRLLALNLPLVSVFAVLWRVLAARGQQALVLQGMIIVTTVELVAGAVLIARWEAIGAAIITPVISLLYVLLLVMYIARDGTHVPVMRLGWRFAAATIGMGLVLYAIGERLPLWSLVPLGAAVYLVLIVVGRAFDRDDAALFREIWALRLAYRSSARHVDSPSTETKAG